jgi:hypothetical protein
MRRVTMLSRKFSEIRAVAIRGSSDLRISDSGNIGLRLQYCCPA